MVLLLLAIDLAAAEVPSPSETTWFGMSVAGLGDVDGDGYPDLMVGAPGEADARAYVYLGGPDAPANPPDQALASASGEGDYGVEVSATGDVDGDGFADAAVGERSCAGGVYVYAGSSAGLDAAGALYISGPACDATIGDEIAAAGDLNGDGLADLAVGSQESEEELGLVLLFYGAAEGLPSEQDRTLSGVSPAGAFGGSLSGAGDVDGDGYGDLLVGARLANGSGEAHLFLGSATGPGGESDARMASGETDALFGAGLAGLGDVNQDGFGDLGIGATGGDENQGTLHLYLGSADGAPTLAETVSGPSAFSYFGASVAGPGDTNADGYADVWVGAYFHERGRGAVQRLLGGPSGLANTTGRLEEGAEATQDWFGFGLDAAGDLNGDSLRDGVVTTLGEVAGAGALHVLWGGVEDDEIPDTGDGEEEDPDQDTSAETATPEETEGYTYKEDACGCTSVPRENTGLVTLPLMMLAALSARGRLERGATKRTRFVSARSRDRADRPENGDSA